VRLTGKGRRQAGEDGVFSSDLWGRGGGQAQREAFRKELLVVCAHI